MRSVATYEAKTYPSCLRQEVSLGETILITRGRKPLVELAPYEQPPARLSPAERETLNDLTTIHRTGSP